MAKRQLEPVEVERIFLYEENPRHEPIESEPEVIAHLCKDEQVFNLARSISEAGPNPLELLGLVKLEGAGARGTKKNYQVWEGNRRVCAIKLLNDPDLAPAHLRKDFARLASESAHVPVNKINAVIFDDHNDLKFWMGIIHNGAQSGVGRLDWDAQQKARHFGGSSRNRVALAVLDTAEDMGLISKDERSKKLTTAQRFLNSSVVREALGIDSSNPADITYNRPTADFQKQLGRFIGDLKEGINVTSRHNRNQIDDYGRKLARNPEISDDRVQPQTLKAAAAAASKKKSRKKAPKKLRSKAYLDYDSGFARALEDHTNGKLQALYHSIYSVRLEHTPLLTIGVWALVESLSALAGKIPDADFVAYFSKDRLASLGFGNGKSQMPLREALTRIQRNGNATKHHEVSASFDAKQLANDLSTITPLLTKAVEFIGSKK